MRGNNGLFAALRFHGKMDPIVSLIDPVEPRVRMSGFESVMIYM
jgi:hypothetical protein